MGENSMLVTVTSHAGIANRIKNIMSAMSQFEEVGTLHEPINYIFPSVKLLDDVVNPYEENWRLHISTDEEKYTETYRTIDLLYEETPQYFIEKYSNIIKRLEINRGIIDYVNDFTKDWKDMVGVHIRSWYCSKNRFHSNDIFEEQIDKLNPEKFFLCSDNSDVQKYFVDKYCDRVVTYERQLFNNPHQAESGHHDDIQITTDAFIELLILSKCSKIIGTYDSTFDEVSWWMSGCKSKVIIPKPNNFDQEYHDSQYLKK
jgi:hypothetical protein